MPPSIPSVFRPSRHQAVLPAEGKNERPLSIAELADRAQLATDSIAAAFSSTIPIRRYLVGADSLRSQAKVYKDEGDRENEFILLVKCARLLVELLPNNHMDWKSLNPEARKEARENGQKVLDDISAVKSVLHDRFERWRAAHANEPLDGYLVSTTLPRQQERPHPSTHSMTQPKKQSTTSGSPGLPYQQPDRSDLSRGFGFTQIPSEARNSLPPSLRSFDALSLSGSDTTRASYGTVATLAYPTLAPRASIRMSAHQHNQGFAPSSHATASYYQTVTSTHMPATATQYAQMPTPQVSTSLRPSSTHTAQMPQPAHAQLPPPLPPHPLLSRMPEPPYGAPHTPPHDFTLTASYEEVEMEARKLMNIASEADEASTSMTEGGEPLRTLIIPSELISRFMTVANPNTIANKETCALLMGSLRRNVFTVTHLVFPKQFATSDTCTTEYEEEVIDYQIQHNLVTLSWIHSHPSQSCFMSSLDLHTHASYQATLPEAIAIVCSPRHEPSFGLFRLTDPTGLQAILACREPGLFHPHLKDGRQMALYTDAVYGHVRLRDEPGGARLIVKDLRR